MFFSVTINTHVSLFWKLPRICICKRMSRAQDKKTPVNTLFSKRSANWLTPVLPVTLGHWPWPKVMSILSNGLYSNMQKTPFKNSIPSNISRLQDNRFRFGHGVFCELLSRPIDKIKITRGRGQWPRDLRKSVWFSSALLSEKSVLCCR